ncbi:MAG: glycosyltransferase [Lachnospiraceae bacterium]|nr:glycosyltransferase [Lachnospiraceae bacterium]
MKNEMTKEIKLYNLLTIQKEKIWFVINTFFTVMYLCWRIFFTIPVEYGVISTVAGLALLIVEVLGMVEAMVHYANMSVVRKYELPQVSEDLYPDVDIFISTYSEEVSLLYKTINGCKRMHYPDKSKVHIYLCDDNRRPKMRRLAERMGINYLDRPDNKGAKAGNLNNALAHSSSPLVVTFDADMIPQSEFLLKTIPYFIDAQLKNQNKKEEDKIKLGFVQTPQAFYNPDLFQFNLFSERRIPNEQDYFYKDIQRARTKTNSVIYGGTNTVLAREALEKIGGFYTEAITEDFATGILIQKAGYVTLGVDDALASGMSVTDLPGLIQQRIRWGRGVIATLRKIKIFISRDLSYEQKINYWASMWYWYAPFKRLIYIMSPLLYGVFGITVVKCDLPQVLLFWLPMYVTSSISLNMLSGNIRNSKWTGIYETILFPFMLVPILLETFGISLKKFKVTDKNTRQGYKEQNLRYKLPFIGLIILSVVGLVRCVLFMLKYHSLGPIVVIFWITYNLYLLIMSLFFADGRVERRKSERVTLSVPCTIKYKDYVIPGITRNISEGGVAILLEKPYYFPEGSTMEVELNDGKYKAELLTEVVYSMQIGDKWNYSMFIHEYKDTYNEYLQILYDRDPILPEEIKKDSGTLEDLKRNTVLRAADYIDENREYPQVLIEDKVEYVVAEEELKSIEGKKIKKVYVADYNFCHFSVRSNHLPKSFWMVPVENCYLKCEYEKTLPSGMLLYQVVNIDEISDDLEKMSLLQEWMIKCHRKAEQNKVGWGEEQQN